MLLDNVDISGSKILIVDDEERNCRLLTVWLESEGYTSFTALSGSAGLALVPVIKPDLIILDLMMPEIDGFQVASQLKHNPDTAEIPLIIITALADKYSLIRALSTGAEEYITKPIDSNELQIRVRNILRMKKASDLLKVKNDQLEEKISNRTHNLKEAFMETINILGNASEFRDDRTGSHLRRISYYTHAISKDMGKDEGFCRTMFYASTLHDVGKISIPDQVLFKKGPLDDEEWKLMRGHTEVGRQMLSGSHSPYIRMGRDISRYHHERWDGTGYPQGLKEQEIPLPARIVSICDVYDALRSDRPYKKALDHNAASKIILEGDGRTEPAHFDPMVRASFERCSPQFEYVFNKNPQEGIPA